MDTEPDEMDFGDAVEGSSDAADPSLGPLTWGPMVPAPENLLDFWVLKHYRGDRLLFPSEELARSYGSQLYGGDTYDEDWWVYSLPMVAIEGISLRWRVDLILSWAGTMGSSARVVTTGEPEPALQQLRADTGRWVVMVLAKSREEALDEAMRVVEAYFRERGPLRLRGQRSVEVEELIQWDQTNGISRSMVDFRYRDAVLDTDWEQETEMSEVPGDWDGGASIFG